MFGIGLPEMILILALALIVVGPEKLPDLARSLAKGIMELKKTAEGFKEQIKEDGNLLEDIRPDLEDAAKTFKSHMLDHPDKGASSLFPADDQGSAEDNAAKAYQELTKAGIDPGEIVQDDPPPQETTLPDKAATPPNPPPADSSTDEDEDSTDSTTGSSAR